MSLQLLLPTSPPPEDRLSSSRLAWSLLVSLMLHLGAGLGLAPAPAEYLSRQAKPVVLTVMLASKNESDSRAVAAEIPISSSRAVEGVDAPPEAEGNLTQKAQLLVAPDLAALEEIAVPFSGSITLRLVVNSRGTVDSVTVVKSDPIPKELLDGLQSRFGQARFSPALAGSQPMVSTRDLVIRYEAAPTPLPRNP
ncbi:MAG: hypothetical protein Q8M11_06120 [Sulfuritalea sp.]|nr:hypothetical protein [Sulfuritalea sp.]MDP1983033.1 hypothetical protein [Sulfuritalea sp.]